MSSVQKINRSLLKGDGSDPLGPKSSNAECAIIGLSGLMVFFAWDDSFNMQVLLPVLVLLLYLAARKNGRYEIQTIILCIVLMATSGISILTSCFLDPNVVGYKSLARWAYLAEILVFYLICVCRSYTQENLRIIIVGVYTASVLITLGTILNWLSGGQGKLAPITVFGTEVAENSTGALLAFVAVMQVLSVLFTKNKSRKLLLIVALITVLFGVLLTGSRAAYIAVGVGFALIGFQYLMDSRFSPITKMLIAGIVVGAVLLFMNNARGLLPDFTYNRLFNPNYDDTSNSDRMILWSFGLDGFLQRPLFGYGIGSYNYYVVNVLGMREHVVVTAHNTYLDSLLDIGLIGTILMAILILSHMKGLLRSRYLVALFAAGAFTALIVGGERSYFFWIEIVILSITARHTHENGGKKALSNLFDLSEFNLRAHNPRNSSFKRNRIHER